MASGRGIFHLLKKKSLHQSSVSMHILPLLQKGVFIPIFCVLYSVHLCAYCYLIYLSSLDLWFLFVNM